VIPFASSKKIKCCEYSPKATNSLVYFFPWFNREEIKSYHFDFRPVKDGKYGSPDSKAPGIVLL
jgi:hypothetical protein